MPEEPHLYSPSTYLHSLSGHPPPFPFSPSEWESLASSLLPSNAKGYLFNPAGPGETSSLNLQAFRRWNLIPSRLVQTSFPDLSTTVLGQTLRYPLALAPVGVQKIFHPEGELAVARAAAAQGVPFTLSSATCTAFEPVASALDGAAAAVGEGGGGAQRWFQLYWPSNPHNSLTLSLLRRAKASGYSALFVTVDTYAMGWRYGDLEHGYNPFLVADHVGVELGLTDEVFREQFWAKHGREVEEDLGLAAREWAGIATPGTSHTWEDLKFLRRNWEGPIVLKGILTVGDARRAVEAGVQGIVVSTHGGREQDGVCGALEALPAIAEAVGEEVDVFFDSGVRSGVDVAKALALGAKCVLLGRPYVWGLTFGGQAGVEHVIRATLGELQMTLHQSGIASVSKKDLNRDVLSRRAI